MGCGLAPSNGTISPYVSAYSYDMASSGILLNFSLQIRKSYDLGGGGDPVHGDQHARK